MNRLPENSIFHALQKIAQENKTPEWGTPEHAEWLQQIGRNAFIYGHMGAGGDDLDKKDWTDADENYECNPVQSGEKL